MTLATEMFVFESGGRRCGLPVDSVVNISRATAAATLPFANDPLEGIIFHDQHPRLQIDLTYHWGGSRRSGAYAVQINTAKGPVVLRVDAIGPPSRPGEEAPPFGLLELEAMLGDLTATEPELEPAPLQPFAGYDGTGETPLLVTETAGVPVAFPAVSVLAVAKHQGSRLLRGSHSGERLVAVAGEILGGLSLRQWLGEAEGAGDGSDEPWGLVLDGDCRRLAVTTERIHGLVNAHRRDLQVVTHRGGTSLCYLDAERGTIEVIDPIALCGRQPNSETPSRSILVPERAPEHSRGGRHPSERRQGLQTRNGVVGQVGPYACAFAANSALCIFREAELVWPAVRGPGVSPVVDLASLLGVDSKPLEGRHAVQLRRPGRRALTVLAEDISPVPLEVDWHPLPIAPPAVHALFEAVGWDGTRCLWLLRPGGLVRSILKNLPSRDRQWFRGWAQLPHDDESGTARV